MSRREKIILALVGLVVLYAAYDLFIADRITSDNVEQSVDVSAITNFLNEISTGLSKNEKGLSRDSMVLLKASSKWTNDPFLKVDLPLKLLEEKTDSLSAADLGLVYSGFLDAGMKLAIINGVEYEKGDALPQPGFIVKKIFPTMVVIGPKDTGVEITIPLKDMD